MTKKWAEVAGSDGFKTLPPEQQDQARRQYFDEVVAPQVPQEHVTMAWDQFSTDAGMGRRELPAGVTPSTAGAGRGNVNPVPETTPEPIQQPKNLLDTATDWALGVPLDGERKGSVLDAYPPEDQAFDFKASSAAVRKLQDSQDRMKEHGSAGPVVGPKASAATIGAGLASDLVAGGKGARAGINQMIGDATDSQYLKDQARKEQGQSELMSAMNTPQFESDTARGVYGGLSSLVRQAPALAAAVVTKNPSLALGGMVAPMVPEEYAKFRQRGATPMEALPASIAMAATEYMTEKAPMGVLVNKFGKVGAGKFLAEMLAKEIPGEQVATAVQDAIDTATANPNKTWGDYLAERPDAAYQTLIATATQGGIMGAANVGARALSDRMQPAVNTPTQPNAEDIARQKGFLIREQRIKTLAEAGDTATADLLQKKHERQSAIEQVDGELQRMAMPPDAAQIYRNMRGTGMKPAEAAARSAVTTTFQGFAAQAGIPNTALMAALDKANGMPLDEVPAFLHKFTAALERRGLAQPTPVDLSAQIESARDNAIEAAMGAVYQQGDIRQTMNDVMALEQQNGASNGVITESAGAGDAQSPDAGAGVADAGPVLADAGRINPHPADGPMANSATAVVAGAGAADAVAPIYESKQPVATVQKAQAAIKNVALKDANPAGNARHDRDFAIRPVEITESLMANGSIGALYKAAGVKSADAFSGLPIESQSNAYAKFVTDGGSPAPAPTEPYNDKVMRMERAQAVARLQSDQMVNQASGKPFKTEASANEFGAKFDLGDTHKAVKVDGGYTLQRLGEGQRPSTLKASAERRANDPEVIRQESAFTKAADIGAAADAAVAAYENGDTSIDEFEKAIGQTPPANSTPAAKIGAPIGVTPAVPTFTSELRPSGTLSVQGDHPAIVAHLTAGGIDPKKITKSATGAVVGASQAKQAQDILSAAQSQSAIDMAAHEAATSPNNDLPQPTQAQKEAGNYAKGHINIGGLDLSIENPAGSTRSGTDRDGKAWQNTLQHHYGYIKGTIGNDNDHVDAFVKPGTTPEYNGIVYVVDQVHPDTGKFDEHKALIGFNSLDEATKAYHANYAKGWKGASDIRSMTFGNFKEWVKDGPKTQPFATSLQPKAAPKPDLTPDQQAQIAPVLERDFEKLYQQDIKTSIKQRLGLVKETETDQKKTPFKSFLREHGINPAHTSDIFGKNRFKANNILPATFRGNGLSLDDLAERAVEHGFMTEADAGDTNKLISLIQSEVAGDQQVSSEFADEDAAAQHERVQRMQIEGMAESMGLPFDNDLSTDRLASMVNRVSDRVARAPKDGLLKADRILKNARDAAMRVEQKRAQFAKQLAEFEAATMAEQDALIDLFVDEDGMATSFMRTVDAQAADQWFTENPTWTNENATDTRANQDSGQAGAPVARVAQEGAGNGRQADPIAQQGSRQEQGANQEGLTSPTRADVLAQQEVAAQAEKAKAKADQDAEAKAKAKRIDKEIQSRQDASADNFQLGQSAEDSLAGQGGIFDAPAATAAKTPSPEALRAQADLQAALADLGDIFGQSTRLNMMPEQEAKILPVMVKLFDAAFRLGYHKFKDAAKFALDKIRAALGDAVANDITLEHLQGAYISMSSGKAGADGIRAVSNIEAKSEIESHTAQTDNERTGESNVPSADVSVERNSQGATPEQTVVDTVSPELRATDETTAETGGRTNRSPGRGQLDGVGLSSGGATAEGDGSDQRVYRGDGQSELASVTAGDQFGERGADIGIRGIPPEPIPAKLVTKAARTFDDAVIKGRAQKAAGNIKPITGDLQNIRDTLPQLLPGQQEDVHKAEQRFAKADGYGMLFTNGTGTGKTFTALGVIKRHEMQGKTNTLILAPDTKIANDWIKAGKLLGLNITALVDTKDAGKGIVITTYANFGQNDKVAFRQWDAVVADEAHSLSQDKDGTPTSYLHNLRAITYHPDGVHQRHLMLHRADIERSAMLHKEIKANLSIMNRDDTMDAMVSSLRSENEKLEKESVALDAKLRKQIDDLKAEVAARQGATRPRLVALSATPFAYEKSIDWGNGYLFDYNEGRGNESKEFRGYNVGSNREQYFMQHFGYRMRTGKLTAPEGKVDSGLLQRQWNANLKKSGALSGRMLDVAPDYDRRFVTVDSAIGNRIDEAIEWLNEQRQNAPKEDSGFSTLASAINDQFKYLQKRYLLEAIKATEVIPIVKQHLDMGRKVVVFHDYKKGGGFNPFAVSKGRAAADADDKQKATAANFNAALEAFNAKFSDLVNHPFGDMDSPIEVFARELPQTMMINGDEKNADLLKRYEKFQDDASGPQVMLVQSAKNKGWSGHDTTGKHQRVLINLGQPTAPTLAIQQEGRIYRTGQASDAIMRYLNTGTNWERWTFASTIAGRASTAENLGMGEMARALKDSFIQSFEESDTYAPGHEGEGKGGKARDKAANEVLTEYDRAKTHYWATQKKTSRTKAQEGTDYFATPEPVGLKMVQWLDARPEESTLEPSAGHGAIARWLPDVTQRTVIEPSLALRSRLALVMDPNEDRIIAGTFEELGIVNKYDGIVMNPPFGSGGKTAIDHLAKAATHLRDGGRIVALIPTGPAADAKFDKWFYESEERKASKPLGETARAGQFYAGDTVSLDGRDGKFKIEGRHENGNILLRRVDGNGGIPEGFRSHYVDKVLVQGPRTESFKPAEGLHLVANIKLPQVTFERAGTAVATRIVVIEKNGANVMQRDRDYSDITDINELFDKLENLDFAPRTKPTPVEPVEPVKAEKPARAPKAAAPTTTVGSDVTLGGKQYPLDVYTTNGGKDLRGVWVASKAEALKYGPSTFEKRGKGFFVRERDFPKVVNEPGAPYTVDAPRRKYPSDKQGDLFNDQLDLFLNSQPDASQEGSAVEVSRRDAVAAVQDLHATGSILAQALSSDYAARQRTNLVGQTVGSTEDLATLAQLYRDPRFETFRVVFTGLGGKVVSQIGLTSRLPGSTSAIVGNDIDSYLKDLSRTAIQRGASGYYLLHNHPSGNANVSEADRRLTVEFDIPKLKFKGHVVIDTNEYSVINAQGGSEKFKHDFGQSAPMTSSQWGGMTFTGPQDVMAVAKQMQVDDDAVTLIVTDAQYKVMSVATVPHVAITEDKNYNRLILTKAALQGKGSNLFAVGRNKMLLARLGGGVMDAIHISEVGTASSLAEAGLIGSRSPFPRDRRTRLSPDTSPEFGYLRPFTMQQTQGRKVAEGKNAVNATQAAYGAQTPNAWTTPEPTRVDRIIYELQDKDIDLKRVQQAVTKTGNTITEQWDARLAETLYPGRVATRSKGFLDNEVKPLLESMTYHKMGTNELADYLHARGAQERNAQIAKVNPDMPDGGAGTNTQGELMTNQAAADYLANIRPARKQVLDAMAKRVDAITAGTRNLLVTEGLEKQSTIDAWEGAYKNYVPMFRDEAESGVPHPQGSGFTVRGSASKRATGSTKDVTNILAHVLMQREAAITRSEKNRVALSLYGLALSNPNRDFWTTIKPGMKPAQIEAELTAMGVDPLVAQAGMAGIPTIRTVDPITNTVVDRINPMYKSLPGAITLRVNGEDRVLMLNASDVRGARLAASLKNLHGLTELDIAGSIVGKATRWLASVNTQYNPAFGLANLTRDVLGGVINLGSTELRGNALKVLADTPMAIVGIAREMIQGGQGGKWQTLYRQFQADGGQTGWKDNWRDPNERAKAIEAELKSIGHGKMHPSRMAHAILSLLDGFNTTLENAVRLSAYSQALDKGVSRQKAARLGRELTVDFNRKGRAGTELGPLYAFFNASVQGTARTIDTIKGPTGKLVIAGGLGLGVSQALMLLVAGYDDDEIPEFVKTRALIIPLFDKEKKFISIPYPLGLHIIPNTGRVMAELALNGGKDIRKRTGAAIGEIAAAFNPLGGGNNIFTTDGLLKTVAPTTLDWLIEVDSNKDFTGRAIEKEAFNEETDMRPGVERTKEATRRSTTGQAYMEISKAINSMTGGTDYVKGAASPTPEMIRYIAQTVGGGVLRELEKTINASTAVSRGEKVKSSQIPVLGRFYGEVDDNSVQQSRYFEASTRIGKLQSVVKALEKGDQFTTLDAFEKENPETDLIRAMNRTKARISKLNKKAVATIGLPDELAEIDADRVWEMRDMNDQVRELNEKTRKPTLADMIRPKREVAVAE